MTDFEPFDLRYGFNFLQKHYGETQWQSHRRHEYKRKLREAAARIAVPWHTLHEAQALVEAQAFFAPLNGVLSNGLFFRVVGGLVAHIGPVWAFGEIVTDASLQRHWLCDGRGNLARIEVTLPANAIVIHCEPCEFLELDDVPGFPRRCPSCGTTYKVPQ